MKYLKGAVLACAFTLLIALPFLHVKRIENEYRTTTSVPSGYFTLGSTMNEVKAIQGMSGMLMRNYAGGLSNWSYAISEFPDTIWYREGKVVGYRNYSKKLKVWVLANSVHGQGVGGYIYKGPMEVNPFLGDFIK